MINGIWGVEVGRGAFNHLAGSASLYWGPSGKTDFSLRLGEDSLKKVSGLEIITNIQMTKPMDRLTVVTKLTELLDKMVRTKHALLILDEAGIFASSGASRRNESIGQWEQIIKLSRKFGLATIWIDQRTFGSVPPTIRELCRLYIYKPTKFRANVYDGLQPNSRKLATWRLTTADRTTLPFDTYSVGSFSMDLPDKMVTRQDGKQVLQRVTMTNVFEALANVPSDRTRPELEKFMLKLGAEYDINARDKERETLEGEASSPPPVSARSVVFSVLSLWKDREGLDPVKDRKRFPSSKDLAKLVKVDTRSVRKYKQEWFSENR